MKTTGTGARSRLPAIFSSQWENLGKEGRGRLLTSRSGIKMTPPTSATVSQADKWLFFFGRVSRVWKEEPPAFSLYDCLLRNGVNSLPLCGSVGRRWSGINNFCKRCTEQKVFQGSVWLSCKWQRWVQKRKGLCLSHGCWDVAWAEQRLTFRPVALGRLTGSCGGGVVMLNGDQKKSLSKRRQDPSMGWNESIICHGQMGQL